MLVRVGGFVANVHACCFGWLGGTCRWVVVLEVLGSIRGIRLIRGYWFFLGVLGCAGGS